MRQGGGLLFCEWMSDLEGRGAGEGINEQGRHAGEASLAGEAKECRGYVFSFSLGIFFGPAGVILCSSSGERHNNMG